MNPTPPEPDPADPMPPFRASWQATPASRRRDLVTGLVRAHCLKILELDPQYPLAPDRPLSEFAVDSVSAVELSNALSEDLGVTLDPTLLFDYPTIDAIAGHLQGELERLDTKAGPNPSSPSPSPTNSIPTSPEAEAPSDADLDRILAGFVQEHLGGRDGS